MEPTLIGPVELVHHGRLAELPAAAPIIDISKCPDSAMPALVFETECNRCSRCLASPVRELPRRGRRVRCRAGGPGGWGRP